MPIKWTRGDSLLATFPTRSTPTACADDIRTIFDIVSGEILPTDILVCKTGEADFGNEVEVHFPACKFHSDKLTDNYWHHQLQIDAYMGKPSSTAGFVVPQLGLEFTKFRFKAKCHDIREDTAIFSWQDGDGVNPGTVTFTDCDMDASETCDWGILYSWFSGVKTLNIIGGTLRFCRFGCAMAYSGGATQTLNINGTRAYGDANGSQTYGESSSPNTTTGGVLSMALNRGGAMNITGVEVDAIGLTAEYEAPTWGCPRIAALCTSQYYSAPTTVTTTIIGCKSNVTPNIITNYYDYDLRNTNAPTIDRQIGAASGGDYKAAP